MRGQISRRVFGRKAVGAGALVAGLLAVPRVTHGASQPWGCLRGRFVYDGPTPERKKLVVDRDIECCGKFDIRDESLMVGPDGGLANVFVYLRSRPGNIPPELADETPERVLLDNRDCIFIPHCLTVWVPRQKLYIVNSDPVAQNVAFSPLGDRPANIILTPPPGPTAEALWEFRRPQVAPFLVKCNYHPWESAYILVRDNPYMAISRPDGTFEIDKLPAGRHEFQVWQERIGYLQVATWPRGRFNVEIKPGTTVDLGTIRLPPALFQT
ncbi:MAG: hypothetical protein NZ899_07695 [Thermoguttaceae bacterium]|nr:hypothetical protein [Thermoguttaceae bacterium]MDW8079025.1 hypothetical protein [Thermoguttaceae bacterium]